MPDWQTLHLAHREELRMLDEVVISDPEWQQLLDHLHEHGPIEWTDPDLTAEEAAHAGRLTEEALALLRARASG